MHSTCSRKKKICRGTPCTTTTTTTTTPAVTTPTPLPSPSFTPVPLLTTTYAPARVTTPASTPGPEEEFVDCRNGWTEWLSEDKPVPFKKNSDIEHVPEKLTKVRL